MQVRLVSHDTLFSADITREMLIELAVDAYGYTKAAAEKLASQALRTKVAQESNGTEPRGRNRESSADLECAKLRTILDQKAHADDFPYGHAYVTGTWKYEFQCLPDVKPAPKAKAEPDLDISKAGANTRKGGARSKLTGAYEIVKRSGPTAESDPAKWEIWQHVWANTSFEAFFKAAPAKGLTKTGRLITAASEIQWAVKSGWIKPVAA